MNPDLILTALAQFTGREHAELPPPPTEATLLYDYAPIQKYALDLKHGAKPETAAEDLFSTLCKDVLASNPPARSDFARALWTSCCRTPRGCRCPWN